MNASPFSCQTAARWAPVLLAAPPVLVGSSPPAWWERLGSFHNANQLGSRPVGIRYSYGPVLEPPTQYFRTLPGFQPGIQVEARGTPQALTAPSMDPSLDGWWAPQCPHLLPFMLNRFRLVIGGCAGGTQPRVFASLEKGRGKNKLPSFPAPSPGTPGLGAGSQALCAGQVVRPRRSHHLSTQWLPHQKNGAEEAVSLNTLHQSQGPR